MTSQIQTQQQLTNLANRIWPHFARLDALERRRRLADIIGVAYALPLAVLGVLWLVRETNTFSFQQSWPLLLALGLLLLLLDRNPFFWIEELRPGRYDRFEASLAPMVTVGALLLFGPSALWVTVIAAGLALTWRYPRAGTQSNRVRELRRRLLQVAALPALLGGAWVYELVGGQYPLAELTSRTMFPASAAIGVLALGITLVYLGFLLITSAIGIVAIDRFELLRLAKQLLLIMAPAAFGMLMSAVYMQLGVPGLVFFSLAAVLATLAANQLSYANIDNSQRTRELEQLEQLGRAIIAAPADGSALPNLLAAYVPFMFQHEQIDIVLFPEETLLHVSTRPTVAEPAMWTWVASTMQPRVIRPNEILPWNGRSALNGMLIAPITSVSHPDPIGGIAIVLPRALNDRSNEIEGMLPAVQTLAAQIGSARQSVESFDRSRALDRLNQDLRVAATIQASFLPASLPQLQGWQIAARLRPARQTSGDFYDAFPLSTGDIALIMADVADKGTGPALFMAVARTLIRTYAFENPTHPDVVLWAVNQRILADSYSGLFVTAFYGVLNPASGQLHYASAGHNPPLLLAASGAVRELRNTGIPLGIEEDSVWRAETITIAQGDMLVLYTDGVPEAQNRAGEFFDMPRLLATAQQHHTQPAAVVEEALLHEIDSFADGAEQFDDQTLMVVVREAVG